MVNAGGKVYWGEKLPVGEGYDWESQLHQEEVECTSQ